MSTKINITIESTGMSTEQANKLAAFLTSLGAEPAEEKQEPFIGRKPYSTETKEFTTPEEAQAYKNEPIEEKPKATRQRAKKVEVTETEEKQETTAEEMEVVAPEVLSPESEIEEEDLNDEPTIKIEDIRKLVAEKQAVHKDFLRAKLKEYGSANVTALPAQYYQSFYALLIALE